jgi:Domain of unknown function (DUF4430)
MTRLPRPRDVDRRRLAPAVVMLVLALALVAPPMAAQEAAPTVRLLVDYGDGVSKTVSGIAWTKGSTVLDVMKAATTRTHGISFSYTGSDAAAVLTRIDDVQNEGGGTGRKNWQYWVNDAYGDRSFATFELQAQDVVVWRFATEQGK